MKKLIALFALAVAAMAQNSGIPSSGTPIQTVIVTADPSGACYTYNTQEYNPLTGRQWACVNSAPDQTLVGTWTVVGGGGSTNPGGGSNSIQYNSSGNFGGILNSGSTKGYLYQVSGQAPTFQLVPIPASDIGAPTFTAGSNMTITGTWPNLTFAASSTASTAFSALTSGTNTQGAMLVGPGASLAPTGAGTIAATSLVDSSQDPVIKTSATASAVDQLTVTNAATGSPATVSIAATGTDSNVNLNLVSKGTGTIECNGGACGGGFTGTPDLIPYVGSDDNLTENSNFSLTTSGSAAFSLNVGGGQQSNISLTGTDIPYYAISNGTATWRFTLDGDQGNGLSLYTTALGRSNASFALDLGGDAFFGNVSNAGTGAGATVAIMASENGHIYTHGTAPAITGTGCTLSWGNDNTGQVAVSDAGTCTITWAVPWSTNYAFLPVGDGNKVTAKTEASASATFTVSSADTVQYSARGVN